MGVLQNGRVEGRGGSAGALPAAQADRFYAEHCDHHTDLGRAHRGVQVNCRILDGPFVHGSILQQSQGLKNTTNSCARCGFTV
jgi:hypothetical protein